ncbi:MAG: hypothetical protein HQM08_23510 [Candidatus Riflebacteria bacterium]|nr:hypothetical protein [Candidatus Riflebacteria bacterium]
MVRMSLILGFFLSVSVSTVVFLLSIVAKVTLATLAFRTLTTFFFFGLLGIGLGSFLEIFLMPEIMKRETARAKEELILDDEKIEEDLGDLLYNKRIKMDESGNPVFQPMVIPKMTIENNQVVSKGDSAVVS